MKRVNESERGGETPEEFSQASGQPGEPRRGRHRDVSPQEGAPLGERSETAGSAPYGEASYLAASAEETLAADVFADEDVESETEASPKKRRRVWKIVVGAIVALAVVIVGSAAALGIFAHNVIGNMHTIGDPFEQVSNRPTPAPTESGKSTPINILIMGSDSRISAGDPNDWEYGAQRTDALMLMQISADRQHISVMSIPRDSWVDIPGHGKAKINAAFSYGGAPLTIQTVEQLTGVRIDHIALVDFTTFQKLTDIVGGVTLNTSAGEQHLTGDEALAFVRERYSLPRGDFDRVRRQQLWMKAVLSELLTKETLSSPSKMMDIANTMSTYVAVDGGLGMSEIVSIGTSLVSFDKSNLLLFTAPVAGTGRSEDGQSIVNLDYDKLAQICKAFQQDTVPTFMKVNGDKFDTLTGRPVD